MTAKDCPLTFSREWVVPKEEAEKTYVLVANQY